MRLASAADTALILGGVAAIVVAISGLVAAIGSLYIAVSTKHKVEQVHAEVTTLNGKTIAVLADDAETRRIAAVPPEARTRAEAAHMQAVPEQTEES